MTADNKRDPQERHNDNIDVLGVILQLWCGKGLVIFFSLLGLGIGSLLVLYTPAKWTSTATVTKPDAAQIAQYTFALSAVDNVSSVDVKDLENQLIDRFSLAFSALAEILNNQSQPEVLTLTPVLKGQPLPLKLSYQSHSPEVAQAQLTHYIEQTNRLIIQNVKADLKHGVQQQGSVLTHLLAAQQQIAQEQKDLHIQQLKEALKVALAVKIIQPQGRHGSQVNQDTLFLLGSEVLTAMVERAAMRPLAYSEDYFQTRQQLLAINALNQDDVNLSSYRYLLKPTKPIYPDGPKTTQVLLFGVLLGGVVGSGVVLVRNRLRDYQSLH